MSQYILAIDQGTTGTTALLLDEQMNVHGKSTVEFPQHFPKPGLVEHDLNEIWGSVCAAVSQCLAEKQINPKQVAAIAITNQRETTCLWRRDADATPVGRAIVWQDRRTAPECAKLKARKLGPWIRRKTGLLLDPYFSATKLGWMLKSLPGARSAAQKGTVAFGTVDSYLLYRLSGEHRTDVTNASRTMLMDLKRCQWDSELLKLFGVPATILPEILPSAVEYGRTRGFLNFPDGIPIAGIAGDQQAALFGQACFGTGQAKCTYGTGAFVVVNTGTKPVYSKNQLLTTVAWSLKGKPTYALEGSAFIAGAAVQWLRDGLGIIDRSSDVEALAASVPDSGGVVFVPALAGLGAPHWLSGATGMITGLTRGTTRAHVARATLEGVAFQVAELVGAMARDTGARLKMLKVDGGASNNSLLMSFQADLLATPVIRSQIIETTALGAALQAGLAIGFWSGLDAISKHWKAGATFKSSITAAERRSRLAQWQGAIEAIRRMHPAGRATHI